MASESSTLKDFGSKKVTIIYCLSFTWCNNLKFVEHINQICLFKILILPPILLPLELCCPGCLHHHLTPTPLYTRAISGAVSVFTDGPQIRYSVLWHWHDSCSLICGTWGTAVFHCYCVCEARFLLWPLLGLSILCAVMDCALVITYSSFIFLLQVSQFI